MPEADSATMIADFMLGSTTRRIRSPHVAPSTIAASSMAESIWVRPASSSSDMKGVVFQISEPQIGTMEVQNPPNQSTFSGNTPKLRLTNPVSVAKA